MPPVLTREQGKSQSSEAIVTTNTFEPLADTSTSAQELPFQTLLDKLAQGDMIKPEDFNVILSTLLSQKREIGELKDEKQSMQSDIEALNEIIRVQEGRLDHLEKEAGKMQDKSVDIQTRMMANNVVIGCLPEAVATETEDTEKAVKDFFRDKLGITTDVTISIAHRYGKKGKLPRPIVVALVKRTDKQLILSKGPALAGHKEWISEQRPEEIRTDQMLLYKHRKAILDESPGLKGKVHVVGTKLMVDKVERKDMRKIKNTCLDRAFNTTTEALNMRPKSGTLTTVESSVFRAHYIAIDCPGKLKAALASVYSQDGAGKASHNSWAMLVNGEEGVDDDGEHGAAREILNVLHERGRDNCMVVVTRWYGGRHIYGKRFDTIKKLTEQVLDMVPV